MKDIVEDLIREDEFFVWSHLTSIQKRCYMQVLAKYVEVLASEVNSDESALKKIMAELNKCVNHPYLVEGAIDELCQSGNGGDLQGDMLILNCGKLFLLETILEIVKRKGQTVVIIFQVNIRISIIREFEVLDDLP